MLPVRSHHCSAAGALSSATITARFALAHHAPTGVGHERGGQALRGSSELHARGDSNLYWRRLDQSLYLSNEHRAAPGTDHLPRSHLQCAGPGAQRR